jgi:hypothetical protein
MWLIVAYCNKYISENCVLPRFSGSSQRLWLRLDWYHLAKKFNEDLNLACRGRAIRNQHLRALVRFLWYGLVSETRRGIRNYSCTNCYSITALASLEFSLSTFELL